MPGRLSGHKRRRNQDDDSEPSDASSANESRSSSALTKRTKVNGAVPSQANGNGGSSLPQHQPGSIVRVAIRDFVTYSKAEFHPGPSLNMVIGPNGTGKSTLVCAICLGLGWKTEHLGRAKDVGEFVKHGAAEATIEVELKADPARHRSNPVIKLNIKKNGSKTVFFLDGKQVPRKTILDECKAFSIQVDNLCQFLPQDRVSEFAGITPVDLLVETQRAVAAPEVSNMHEELKTLHVEYKKATIQQAGLAETLKNLENRQNDQLPDVERLQQRSRLQEEIRALEIFRPMVQYKQARRNFETFRDKKRVAQEALSQLELDLEPALRAINEKRAYQDAIEGALGPRRKLIKRSEDSVRAALNKQKETADKIKTAETEIESEASLEKTQKAERARIEAKVRNIEVRMNEDRPDFDAANYNERIREISRDMLGIRDRAEEAKARHDQCTQRIRDRNSSISSLRRELEGLRSQSGQQMGKLKTMSIDTFKAWNWIQDNLTIFDGPIYGPPVISCSVKDPRNAVFVEAVMGAGDYLAITATNSADFKLLQDKLAGDQRLSDIYLRTSSAGPDQYRLPCPKEQLLNMGLDCYLTDLMQGPDPVLGMLCDTRNIHQTAVAFKDLSPAQYQNITASTIGSFVTPSEVYTITRRREYGDRGASTRARQVRPPRVFTSQAVDTSAELEINDQITAHSRDIDELMDESKTQKGISADLGKRYNELETAKTALQEEKDNKQKALSAYNALPTQLETAKDKLEEITNKIRGFAETRQSISDRIAEHVMTKAQDAVMLAANVQALQKLHTDLVEAEVQLIEAKSDLEGLEARSEEVTALLEERQREVDELTTQQQKAREEAVSLSQKASDASVNRSEREKEIHEQQPDDLTPDALETSIVALQARMELVHEGNPNVMREFEERGQKIEKTKEKLEQSAVDAETVNVKIQEIRQRWEPELNSLIAKINDAFGDNMSRINCAGLVEMEKPEDFAEWSIVIKVKFREHEQLTVLDQHRQSGGERSVSTIFYLMSLQSLARAPFRVVDEINQGMDPRNER